MSPRRVHPVAPLHCRFEVKLECDDLALWNGYSLAKGVSTAQMVREAVKHYIAEGLTPDGRVGSMRQPVQGRPVSEATEIYEGATVAGLDIGPVEAFLREQGHRSSDEGDTQ